MSECKFKIGDVITDDNDEDYIRISSFSLDREIYRGKVHATILKDPLSIYTGLKTISYYVDTINECYRLVPGYGTPLWKTIYET